VFFFLFCAYRLLLTVQYESTEPSDKPKWLGATEFVRLNLNQLIKIMYKEKKNSF
jgi:hypothetical protein